MYAREIGDGKVLFAVESHTGYAEVVLEDGIIKEAYLGNSANEKQDFMHKAYNVLKHLSEVSLPCYVEMFEMLRKEEHFYDDAKHFLKMQRNFHKVELLKKQKFQDKLDELLQNA